MPKKRLHPHHARLRKLAGSELVLPGRPGAARPARQTVAGVTQSILVSHPQAEPILHVGPVRHCFPGDLPIRSSPAAQTRRSRCLAHRTAWDRLDSATGFSVDSTSRGGKRYLRKIIFLVSAYTPALTRYRYTPVATGFPCASRPSQFTSTNAGPPVVPSNRRTN